MDITVFAAVPKFLFLIEAMDTILFAAVVLKLASCTHRHLRHHRDDRLPDAADEVAEGEAASPNHRRHQLGGEHVVNLQAAKGKP